MNKIMMTAFLLCTAGIGTLLIGQTDVGAPAAQPKEAKDQVANNDAAQSISTPRFQDADHMFVVINFSANSAVVSGKQKEALRNSLDSARTDGTQLERVIVAAWSDSALPMTSDVKLPDAALKLADERASNLEDYIRELGAPRVDTHSMAEHANWLERLFNTNDAKIKESIQSRSRDKSVNTSLTEQLISQGGPQKALVLIFREKAILAH